MDLLTQMPCWYVIIAGLLSLYQGCRGVVEQRRNYLDNLAGKKWKTWEKIVILYVHDFIFRLVCTMAGFVALYVSYILAKGIFNLSLSASVLLAFSFLIGVIGVGGQLHYVILMGRWPK